MIALLSLLSALQAVPVSARPAQSAAAKPAAAEPDVPITAVPAAGGVTMFEGEGGNIGVLVGADGVLVIDDQYAKMSDKVRAAIAKLSPSPVRFVVNTHWHGDHTGGNEALARGGGVIVAQENVRKRMNAPQKGLDGEETPASPAAALPVITYGDEVRFHVNGEEVHVIHVPPAHTDGDSIVVFERANVIHTGDTLFTTGYPYIDLTTGGSLDGMIAAEERVLKLANDATKIIPGHGHLCGKAELREAHDMLVALRDRVRKLIRQKKTLDQILAAKPTADLDARWGQWFIKPDMIVTIAYHSLAKSSPAAR